MAIYIDNSMIGADSSITKDYLEDNYAKINPTGDIVIEGEIKAENIPHTVSEVTLITIPAATIQEAITNNVKKLTIDSFTWDINTIVYAYYGGKEYASYQNLEGYLEFFVANPYITNGFACGFQMGEDAEGNADSTKGIFNYRVLDTENVTDLVLKQMVINTIDSKYFDHDFTIINSISMNRRGDTGTYSTALGGSCVASGDSSFATGLACEATGSFATAVGKGSFATGEAGFSTGLMTTAGREAIASGRYCEATGRGSLATGNTTKASGQYSVAEGQSTQATASHAHVEGMGSIAKGVGSHAEGNYTLASSEYQHVQGKYNVEDTAKTYAHIVGNGTSSARSNIHTLKWTGEGWFKGDVYVGSTSGTNKDEGSKKLATEEFVNEGLTSLEDKALVKISQTLTDEELAQVRQNLKFIGKNVEGETFNINGNNIIASPNAEIFGDYESNKCTGQWSIVEGSANTATGRACHVEGAQNQATNDGCHVEGISCIATGYWSHAEGEMTRVTSYASHAEGSYTKMPDGSIRYGTASGYASHIEGGGCHAQGSCSHSEGLATTTKGNYSHSEGKYTIASSPAQHVEGAGNIEDTEGKYIHIAGNGDFNAPSNAYTLDWDGNGWFAGTVEATAIILKSSTEGSNKKFRLTVDDSGTLSINEII